MGAVFQELCVSLSQVKSTRERLHFQKSGQLIRPSLLFEVDPRVEQGYAMRKGAKSEYLTALMSLVTPEVSQPSSLRVSNMRGDFLVDTMVFVNRF